MKLTDSFKPVACDMNTSLVDSKWKKCMESKLHRNQPATKIDMEALQKHVEDCPDNYKQTGSTL